MLLTPVLVLGSQLEALIPYEIALMINSEIKPAAALTALATTPGFSWVMALAGLLCGYAARYTCAKASLRLLQNLRQDMFYQFRIFLLQHRLVFPSTW